MKHKIGNMIKQVKFLNHQTLQRNVRFHNIYQQKNQQFSRHILQDVFITEQFQKFKPFLKAFNSCFSKKRMSLSYNT